MYALPSTVPRVRRVAVRASSCFRPRFPRIYTIGTRAGTGKSLVAVTWPAGSEESRPRKAGDEFPRQQWATSEKCGPAEEGGG